MCCPGSQRGCGRKRRLTGKAQPPDPLTCPLEKACPPGKEVHVVDENLVFYTEQELEACVDGALLAEHMDRVNAIPFTYQQLDILKHKLDQVVPDLGSRLLAVPKPFPATWDWLWPSRSISRAGLPTGVPRVPDPAPELLLP